MKSILLSALAGLIATSAMGAEQWVAFETSFTSARKYANPFVDVQVDVVFRSGEQQWLVPAFWAGGDKWTVRFAPPVQGDYTFQVKCSDPAIDPNTIASMTAAYAMKPPMLALVGEVCYEGHMQQGFGDVQRRVFWSYMLSGAAGHTYGAAGIWHASVEGDPGCATSGFGGIKVYDWTTWKDYGTPTRRENARLVGGKGMVTVAEKISELDLMASVDAHRDAEAGIILRFHDADNYLVALYSPLLKAIFLHDRKNGQWGEALGKVEVPEVGPKIQLVAAACGEFAALVLTDGQRTYTTPLVKVGNTTPGKTGLWLFQIGERQEFGRFAVSATPFDPPKVPIEARLSGVIRIDEYHAPDLPSPQDWVLVLERVKP